MRYFILVFVFLFQALPAWAACEGTDLIAALPDDQRQALRSRASNSPYPEGLLWRASRGQTEITFFGTYHFAHDRTQAHLEALKPRINAADEIYLEVSNDDHAEMERAVAVDPSIMFITEGPTLIDLLGEEDWATYKAAMEERMIPGFMAAKFKPFWAAIMLGVGPCETREGAFENEGIDIRIGKFAEEIGNPSRSLEDYRDLLKMFDSFSQEDQLDMIRLFFAWSGNPDDMSYTLRQRYLAEDTGMIWEYTRMISLEFGGENGAEDFALFEQQMLIDRNQSWIELLLGEAEGKQVFAAVGAAHLPGPHGVLNLLEQNGFTVTRLEFTP